MYSPYKLYMLHLNKQGNKNVTADIYHVHLQVHTFVSDIGLSGNVPVFTVCLRRSVVARQVKSANLFARQIWFHLRKKKEALKSQVEILSREPIYLNEFTSHVKTQRSRTAGQTSELHYPLCLTSLS